MPTKVSKQSVSAGAGVKHVARDHGHHCQILQAEDRVDRDDAHDARTDRELRMYVESLLQCSARRNEVLDRHPWRQLDLRETGEHGEVAQRVDAEAPGQTVLARTTAAIDGPTMRARLNPPELSAIASTMSSRATSSTIIDLPRGNLERGDHTSERRQRHAATRCSSAPSR